MKYQPWQKHDGSIYSLDMKQFDSLFKLRAILNNIKRINLSRHTIDWLAQQLKALVNKQTISYDAVVNPSPVYRAQLLGPDEPAPSNISRLWYPPVEKVLKMGRLNRKKQPIFYCSSSIRGVLFEMDPCLSACIGIMKCTLLPNKPPIEMVQLGVDRAFLARTGNTSDLERRVSSTEKRHASNLVIDDIPIGELSESYLIQKFIHEILSHKPSPDEHDFYKLTVAISEIWLHDSRFSGIVYPGVTTKFLASNYATGENLAIRTDVVDHYYRAQKVWLCRCSLLTERGYGLETLKSSANINTDGEIQWSPIADELPGARYIEPPNSQ